MSRLVRSAASRLRDSIYVLLSDLGVEESASHFDFLKVVPGDLVVVEDSSLENKVNTCWWLGHVIHSACGARHPSANSIFQVVDIDTGLVRTVNADLVKGILRPRETNNSA